MHQFAQLKITSGSIGIHWFGQSSFALMDSEGVKTLIDPYFPHDRPDEKFVFAESPVDESELPVDHVLFTHDHPDHTHTETVSRIAVCWPDAEYIGPKESIARITSETPVSPDQAVTMHAGETINRYGMKIHAVLAQPVEKDPSSTIEPAKITHLGYVIDVEDIRLYFSGDTINTFADSDDLIAPVTALKPKIGFITMHPDNGEFPSFEESVKIADKIGLTTVVPSHYACFKNRTYDPVQWAPLFSDTGPRAIIIPYNSHIIYP